MTLAVDLCTRVTALADAADLATAVLRELRRLEPEEVVAAKTGHVLRTARTSKGAVALRPVNPRLFEDDPDAYQEIFDDFVRLLRELFAARGRLDKVRLKELEAEGPIGRALYTTVQAMGCGMDLLLAPNKARKNLGMRFEDVVELVLAELGLGHEPKSFALPYEVESGTATFRNQVDLVVSATPPVSSRTKFLDPDEIVVSIKTSSKDRFGKIFLDKELLRFVTGQKIPVLALFHNDVQRSGADKVSVTFVAGNFNAYVERFGPLTGVYYVDPPPHIHKEPWKAHLRTFDDLILRDLWETILA